MCHLEPSLCPDSCLASGIWRLTWHQLFLVRSSAWVSYDGRHPSLPLNSQRPARGWRCWLCSPRIAPGSWKEPVVASTPGSQQFSFRDSFATRPTLAVSGDVRGCHSWRRWRCWHFLARGSRCCSASYGGQRALLPQSINPQDHRGCWDGGSPVSVCHEDGVPDSGMSSPTAVLKLPCLCVPAVLTGSLGGKGSLSPISCGSST